MGAFKLELIKLTDVEVIENTIGDTPSSASMDPTGLSHAIGYNFDVKMDIPNRYVRVFFTLQIISATEDENPLEMPAVCTIAHGFEVANLDVLASDKEGIRTVELELLYNLFGIVYDRACGMISGLAQNTYLHGFVMPVLSTEELRNILSKENGYLPN